MNDAEHGLAMIFISGAVIAHFVALISVFVASIAFLTTPMLVLGAILLAIAALLSIDNPIIVLAFVIDVLFIVFR